VLFRGASFRAVNMAAGSAIARMALYRRTSGEKEPKAFSRNVLTNRVKIAVMPPKKDCS